MRGGAERDDDDRRTTSERGRVCESQCFWFVRGFVIPRKPPVSSPLDLLSHFVLEGKHFPRSRSVPVSPLGKGRMLNALASIPETEPKR
jgi:hypothetical protein